MSGQLSSRWVCRRTVLLTALCGGAGRLSVAAGGSTSDTAAMIRLPTPSRDVILRWESLGGTRVADDRAGAALLIHADGSYSAPAAIPGGERRTGVLSSDEMRALLTDVLARQQFVSIDASDIEARIRQAAKASGRIHRVMDGGVTRISIRLPDVQHSVEVGNLHSAHQAFPDIEPLQRLHAVQQVLVRLAGTAR